MEPDKSFLLQKQVKDNSEDLQSEFLDMKNWEEQMKRKEEQLLQQSTKQESLPPVRTKKPKKLKRPTVTAVRASSRRLKCYDHFSSNKLNALEMAYKDDKSSSEDISTEELEENHEQATKLKMEGNTYVQQQKWNEAVIAYNEAIKLFAYDPTYYANRALCHLKLQSFYRAESDCSMAIYLDDTYVKAYHRRAVARIALDQYEEAMKDLEKVLEMDPFNNETKIVLTKLIKKIKETEPNTLAVKRKIGVSLCKTREEQLEKICLDPVCCIKENEQQSSSERRTRIENVQINDVPLRDIRIPEWLPEKHNVEVIEPITKPAHLKSQNTMTKIFVREVEHGVKRKTQHTECSTSRASSIIEKSTPNPPQVQKLIEDITEIPPAPKTAVQFVATWKGNKSLEFRYKYLKQLPSNSLPVIFQDSMESSIFSDIIAILRTEFLERKEPVFQILIDLSKVKRFRALIMFTSNEDKECLRALLDYCKNVEKKSPDEITGLSRVYEL